uniref:Uncharacterized protein n=1 Tax=Callorhinchus milii TaxID=7868 RepID=A0A4W3HZY8_CALMI|eukprot:gi/632967073/ref/XP_007899777.1/ PREDICTED: F-box only protein 4 [Callorhinchus milii]
MFEAEGRAQDGASPTLIPSVQAVCSAVDGFIYTVNAEAHTDHQRDVEVSRVRAVISAELGPADRPLLVLSCVSRPGVSRVPCVYIAHQLHLQLLTRPWLVQDVEVTTLNGFLEGIGWLLQEIRSGSQ